MNLVYVPKFRHTKYECFFSSDTRRATGSGDNRIILRMLLPFRKLYNLVLSIGGMLENQLGIGIRLKGGGILNDPLI